MAKPVLRPLGNSGVDGFAVDVTDVDAIELARRIADEQEAKTGISYSVCKCGMPVSARTAWKAKKQNKTPCCRACRPRLVSKDETVYMCSICRAALTGKRLRIAREMSKRGFATTCGAAECRKMTTEQRSEAARKAARKLHASMTPEQRSERARKAAAAMTPEQRSEKTRKGWETRRAKKRVK